ncbi:serine/threonine protein kinase [Mycobacterium conspicuum]|jgi:hypothetical protein|uniref:Serine/threonine protein kinase n=2 Tax=Mycobacterium conspicuum TaxID=44010 RepID=A0A7I7Y848_9MYCO|nr:serine/threonine protein kinase [Mycobacterium conspicuum]BBZ37212.1 hypothetical protein MCNS_02750 [Mycobacterium conspicuum]
MSHLFNALRAATAAALMGSFVWLAAGTAAADPEPTPPPPPAPSGTPDPGTGTEADINNLAGNLSKGYGLNNCTAQPITGGQLASLLCGQNPDPKGPVQAKFYLFSKPDDMTTWFKNSAKDDVLVNCGDSSTKGPAPWHQGNNATTNGGQMLCGTYQDGAEIIWTTDAKNILSYIRASNGDTTALYKWWQANG